MIEVDREPVWVSTPSPRAKLEIRWLQKIESVLRVREYDQLAYVEVKNGAMVAGWWAKNGTPEELKTLAESLRVLCEIKFCERNDDGKR